MSKTAKTKRYPVGKEWRRKRENAGHSLRAMLRRRHAADKAAQGPTAESEKTNHERHLMRRAARNLLRENQLDPKLKAASDAANAEAMEKAQNAAA